MSILISNQQNPTWWQNAVGYQIYPKSFFDSNHDGIGDIQGIISKMPYIKSLGVNFVWLSPFFASPNIDNGYDVSDYQAIDPQYGTLDDIFEMIDQFHQNNIRVVFDLVINHTSDQHHWFKEAKKSVDNPYHDFYIWRKPVNGNVPNNWVSLFGGSAWEYNPSTKDYYYHLFAKQQPDLNWENPKVHQAVAKIIDWWAERGVDGFRLDAISHLKKNQRFKDVTNQEDAMNNVSGIDQLLANLSTDFKRNHLMTVGEAGGVPVEQAKRWVDSKKGYFDMIFQFDHVSFWEKFTVGKVDVAKLRVALTRWQSGLDNNGWNALFLENHDLPRAVSYFGNDQKFRSQSATALAMMYFLMKGTPFIYQGQELGMTNVDFNDINQFRDLDSQRFYREELAKGASPEETLVKLRAKSRDNARTPMQWNDQPNGGFSDHQPWISSNPNARYINVANEVKQPDSVLNFYRQLIHLRLKDPILLNGQYQLIETHDHQSFVYQREENHVGYLVITNLSDQPATVTISDRYQNRQLVLTNTTEKQQSSTMALKPWAAYLYKYERN
ncbi:glycoside hydrolase family 13 protein [Lentilactobacillus hilgardii]|uniref:glycoside hydrolase family 13 protein n=1 Tax=Lentilactobacillus hilgardii TaxID=1588 RepID=UPI0021C314B4|nr:alpha-glucosidase [Lentilactobacillus hilgardii]MCP9332904.1 alpha-glucosidase [Lentilactobacillus hilgardii]MCP9349513.1 alpha-glucosidase [Lentilactobacillus hilgardii]MCP9352381.1 alpha-glucosidase [Lentilactobacillus hilgardii]